MKFSYINKFFYHILSGVFIWCGSGSIALFLHSWLKLIKKKSLKIITKMEYLRCNLLKKYTENLINCHKKWIIYYKLNWGAGDEDMESPVQLQILHIPPSSTYYCGTFHLHADKPHLPKQQLLSTIQPSQTTRRRTRNTGPTITTKK